MNKTPRFILLAAVGVTALACLSGADKLFRAAPTRVAVVNVFQLWRGIDATAEMNAELEDGRQKFIKEQEERKKKFQDLQQDMEWAPDDSADRRKKQKELEHEAFTFQVWLKWQENLLAREEKIRYEDLYRRTLDAIKEVAEANGVDLVLFQEVPPNFAHRRITTKDHVVNLIANRKVLYASEELDMTDQVITRMNNKAKDVATE